MVDTIKFSEFDDGGDLEPNQTTVGLDNTNTVNTRFSNPFPLLAPGSTGDRPAPDPNMYYRLRFNTTLQSYEYYSPVALDWIQLEDSIDVQSFPFVIYTAEPLLPMAFDLGTLTDGILKQTVAFSSATPAIAINGTDYYGPGFSGYFEEPIGVKDTTGNIVVAWTTAGINSVNYIEMLNSYSGFPVEINALGTDADIGINISSKGTAPIALSTLAATDAINIFSGTAYQHETIFAFANTANTRTVTFQDLSGTVAYLSDLTAYVQSVTGTANQIDVDNTDPQNPILSLSATLIAPGTARVGNILLDTNTISSTNVNGAINITPNGNGLVNLGTNFSILTTTLSSSSTMNFSATTPTYSFLGTTATQASIRLREAPNNGTDYVGLQAPASVAALYTLTLPDAAPSVNGQVISFTTAGVGSFVDQGTMRTASISGTTQNAAVNTRYIVANASQTTITLPATYAIGDVVIIKGLGAGGWILAANTGDTIQIGSSATSSGGSLTSANQYDTVYVSGLVANTTWSVDYVLSSGLTVA